MRHSSVNLLLELPNFDLNTPVTGTSDPLPMVGCIAPGSLSLAGLRSPPTSLHPTAEFKIPAQARQLSTLFKFEDMHFGICCTSLASRRGGFSNAYHVSKR